MTWCKHLLNAHGRYIKDHAGSLLTPLRALQKAVILQVRLGFITGYFCWLNPSILP